MGNGERIHVHPPLNEDKVKYKHTGEGSGFGGVIMEICCDNCKTYKPPKACDILYDCLHTRSTKGRVGEQQHYYNHFVPKEDKMPMMLAAKHREETVEYKPTGKSLTAREVIAKSNITFEEMEKLIAWARGRVAGADTELIVNPDHSVLSRDFLTYALSHGCFRSFLFNDGYIEPVEDKWNPNSGEWMKVGWENVQQFLPGVMINRVFKGQDSVMEITDRPYWKECVGRTILAINIRTKSIFKEKDYSTPRHYYLSDLFNGKVSMRL